MKSRILVVDDEESIRFTFKRFLSGEGHEVLTAADFGAALRILSEVEPDVIFADIILGGGCSGIDLLREAKGRGLQCPVVLITGEPNVKTSAEAVRLDAFDYLTKPIRKDEVLRAADRALRHKALSDRKKEVEEEKERYRRNLEAIFRCLKDAVVTVDKDMRVIEANGATSAICGFAPQDALGRRFDEIPHPCVNSCRQVIEETLKTQGIIKEYRLECQYQGRPNQVVVLTCSPLTDPDDKPMGAVLVIRDRTRITDLERELKERYQFHHIIGKSRKMQELYALLEDLAETDSSVLISGETGTGKELVAKALHYEGVRRSGPLVTVNCSALSENILESELFGHVKGAFTGAVRDKVGRFQMANGGTIFLDEIGDISMKTQLNLLRVLQEKEFERVGESKPVQVDVRFIAATNRDLKEKIRLGEFREDLYYRLKVVEIEMPPLRERVEDIPLLVEHFVKLNNQRFKKDIDGVSDEVVVTFMDYPWQGNVRELEHAIEHAFVVCHDRTIRLDHLPADIRQFPRITSRTPERGSVDDREDIIEGLSRTGWNKAKAARVLNMSRQTLYRKIEEYGITEPI